MAQKHCIVCLKHEINTANIISNVPISDSLYADDAIKIIFENFDIKIESSKTALRDVPKMICYVCQEKVKTCWGLRNVLKQTQKNSSHRFSAIKKEPTESSEMESGSKEKIVCFTENICRVCLQPESNTENRILNVYFNSLLSAKQAVEIVFKDFRYNLDLSTCGTPKMICIICQERMKTYLELKNLAEKSQQQLLNGGSIALFLNETIEISDDEDAVANVSLEPVESEVVREIDTVQLANVISKSNETVQPPAISLQDDESRGTLVQIKKYYLRKPKNLRKFYRNCVPKIAGNAKTYICDQCGKKFVSKVHILHHLKMHFNIREYMCHFCAKAYIDAYRLNRHIVTHTVASNLAT